MTHENVTSKIHQALKAAADECAQRARTARTCGQLRLKQCRQLNLFHWDGAVLIPRPRGRLKVVADERARSKDQAEDVVLIPLCPACRAERIDNIDAHGKILCE